MTTSAEAILVGDGFTNAAVAIVVDGPACGDTLPAKLIVVVVGHCVKGGERGDGELPAFTASLNIVNDDGKRG